MRSSNIPTILILVVLLVVVLTGTAAIYRHDQVRSPGERQRSTAIDETQFPIVDYTEPEPTDPVERAKKHAKGQKYNRPETAVDPRLITVSDIYYWDASMPSLPVAQSDAVIIGEVTRAEAHLSNDKTGVYSEFTIQISQVLK